MGKRIALVTMPWGSIRKPSLALGILKQCAKSASVEVDLHFLNMRFARRLGLGVYEDISDNSFIHAEWFFSPALFGSGGLDEMQNDWDAIVDNPGALRMRSQLMALTHGSAELCKNIAEVQVPKFIEECTSEIDWAQYTMVGFTTTFAQSLSSLLLAKAIKDAHPDVKIVFGGANVDSGMGAEFMNSFPWLDYVVHGEAEYVFPVLLRQVLEGNTNPIPGVSMRSLGKISNGHFQLPPPVDMNDSPVPDYSDYVAALESYGFGRHLNLYYESSRGCWWGTKHHCTFCGLNGDSMAFRRKDAERVYAELIELSNQYRCFALSATDNILATDYFTKLLPALAQKDIDLQLFYEVKANLSRSQVQLLKAAGIREIQPGIESLSSRLLQLMNKGVSAIQNVQLLKWCLEVGITPYWNIIYGFPGEEASDYVEFPKTCRLVSHLCPPENVQPLQYQRFSPYHNNPASYGLTLRPIDAYQFIFPQPRVCLDNIAYYFDGYCDSSKVCIEEYMQPVFRSWRAWVRSWKKQEIYCYYRKGPDFLIVYDNRPTLGTGTLEGRKIVLGEELKAIYLFCDQCHSLRSICEMVGTGRAGRPSVAEVEQWLNELVETGLMLREGDRYLALAIRQSPTSRPTIPYTNSDSNAMN